MNLYGFLRWLDYGVKGQKRGQHVKARDPEYLARLKGGKVSNVKYSRIGISNASTSNAKKKLNNLKNEIKSNKGKITKEQANKLFNLNKIVSAQTARQNKFAQGQKERRNLMASYNEAMNKYKTNQKLLKAGITNEIVPKPELPKQIVERANKNKLRILRKQQNIAASKPKIKPKQSYIKKLGSTPLRRLGKNILNSMKKHKGKLGLAAGAGLGLAGLMHNRDCNYNIIGIKGNNMNVNQKIKFLKHRRHMDALRIKRLKRRLDLGVVPKMLLGVTGGLAVGSLIGAVMAKVMNKLNYDYSIDRIYAGKALPEKDYVKAFQVYFTKNSSNIGTRFMEPGYWRSVNAENYKDYLEKVNGARTANDLVRIFPDHTELKKIAAAYKAARASGLY